jgi:hypothetical protein
MAGATHLLPMYRPYKCTWKTLLLSSILNSKSFFPLVFEVSGSGDFSFEDLGVLGSAVFSLVFDFPRFLKELNTFSF